MTAGVDTGSVLEIVIALSFLYFLLSLVCSAINEAVASFFRWRPKDLKLGLINLLGKAGADDFFADRRIQALGKVKKSGFFQSPDRFWKKIAEYSQLRRLGYRVDGTSALSKPPRPCSGVKYRLRDPSYIPSETAGEVILSLMLKGPDQKLRDRGLSDSDIATLKKAVGAPVDESGLSCLSRVRTRLRTSPVFAGQKQALVKELELLEKELTTEFDNTMDRVSGWYKRKATIYLGLIALIVTCLLNVDTINIAKSLDADPVARAALVAGAEKVVKQKPVANDCDAKNGSKGVSGPTGSTGLTGPTGPTDPSIPTGASGSTTTTGPSGLTSPTGPTTVSSQVEQSVCFIEQADSRIREFLAAGFPIGWKEFPLKGEFDPGAFLSKLVGLMLTVIALTLGAPFWFQMISRLTPLRATGPVESGNGDAEEEST